MAGLDSMPRAPRWYLIPVRVLLITCIITLLSFAVSLLIGIAAVLISAELHSIHPDLRSAYRLIAFPAASAIGIVAFVSASVMESRYYLRARALYRMEHHIGHAR
jgi:hypothetical protein